MGDVHDMRIPPKQHTERYRKILITITYVPEARLWEWSFDIEMKRRVHNTAKDMNYALKCARTRIDELVR